MRLFSFFGRQGHYDFPPRDPFPCVQLFVTERVEKGRGRDTAFFFFFASGWGACLSIPFCSASYLPIHAPHSGLSYLFSMSIHRLSWAHHSALSRRHTCWEYANSPLSHSEIYALQQRWLLTNTHHNAYAGEPSLNSIEFHQLTTVF